MSFGSLAMSMQALPSTGWMAGSVLVFVLCMNTYATAVLLGGPRFKMMAPAVYDQFVRGNNWPFGAALSFLLMYATFFALALRAVLMRKEGRGDRR